MDSAMQSATATATRSVQRRPAPRSVGWRLAGPPRSTQRARRQQPSRSAPPDVRRGAGIGGGERPHPAVPRPDPTTPHSIRRPYEGPVLGWVQGRTDPDHATWTSGPVRDLAHPGDPPTSRSPRREVHERAPRAPLRADSRRGSWKRKRREQPVRERQGERGGQMALTVSVDDVLVDHCGTRFLVAEPRGRVEERGAVRLRD
jgi:hypothetical protein